MPAWPGQLSTWRQLPQAVTAATAAWPRKQRVTRGGMPSYYEHGPLHHHRQKRKQKPESLRCWEPRLEMKMGTGHSKHLGETLGLLLDTGGQVIPLSCSPGLMSDDNVVVSVSSPSPGPTYLRGHYSHIHNMLPQSREVLFTNPSSICRDRRNFGRNSFSRVGNTKLN